MSADYTGEEVTFEQIYAEKMKQDAELTHLREENAELSRKMALLNNANVVKELEEINDRLLRENETLRQRVAELEKDLEISERERHRRQKQIN